MMEQKREGARWWWLSGVPATLKMLVLLQNVVPYQERGVDRLWISYLDRAGTRI